jgi:quercetin dioxygenase-like cupin family protein
MKLSSLRFFATGLLVPAGLYAATCGMTKPDAMDAAAVAPDLYKTVIDNETVRVLEVTLAAGAKEPAHSHVWPAVIIEDTPRPGSPEQVRNFKARWEPAVKADKGGMAAKAPVHYLRVELKKADCAPMKNPPLPPTDGVVVKDPTIKVALENEYVRLLEMEVKPGESEPPHTHTWPTVLYYYRLPTSRRGTADGKPSVDRPEVTKQQISWEGFSQPIHTLLNTGNFLYQAHRLEIKPVTDEAKK